MAQKSQKDPKEYLQFLNELKRYPETYRKFKIDSHLKKFDSALKHLVSIFSLLLSLAIPKRKYVLFHDLA